jgi:hypothetical protein
VRQALVAVLKLCYHELHIGSYEAPIYSASGYSLLPCVELPRLTVVQRQRLAGGNARGLAIAGDSFAVNQTGHLLQGRYDVEKETHAQQRMLRVAAQLWPDLRVKINARARMLSASDPVAAAYSIGHVVMLAALSPASMSPGGHVVRHLPVFNSERAFNSHSSEVVSSYRVAAQAVVWRILGPC